MVSLFLIDYYMFNANYIALLIILSSPLVFVAVELPESIIVEAFADFVAFVGNPGLFF